MSMPYVFPKFGNSAKVQLLIQAALEWVHWDGSLLQALKAKRDERQGIKNGTEADKLFLQELVMPGCARYDPSLQKFCPLPDEVREIVATTVVDWMGQKYAEYAAYWVYTLGLVCEKTEKQLENFWDYCMENCTAEQNQSIFKELSDFLGFDIAEG